MDTVAQLTENILFWNFAVIENKFGRWRAAHPELVELLPCAKSFKSALDYKRRDATGASIRIGLGIDNQRRGMRAVGNPHFSAVQDIAIALFGSTQPHRHDIGARTRFRHGERAHMFTR